MKTEINKELVDVERVSNNLTRAIQIKTIAHSDESLTDWAEFDKFHAFLKEAFPLVHQNLKLEIIRDADMLYFWEGSDKNLDPIAFLSHQDVVPVTPGTENDWTHPAFEGYNDGEYIWGRGAIDMKNHLIAVMESIETLLEEGYKPVRSVYLCFGHNEEVMSENNNGAINLSTTLKERGIHVEAIIDEGGAMFPLTYNPVIDCVLTGIGIGEKGYADYKVTVKGKGGHSAAPPDHSAIGELAQKIQKLENHQFPSEVPDYFIELIVAIVEKTMFPLNLLSYTIKPLKPLITIAMKKIPAAASFIRSCQAVTMCQGSPAPNVLPQRASATVNFRLLQGTTLKDAEAKIEKYMGGKNVEIEQLEAREASHLSPTDSRAFKTIKRIVEESNPKAVVSPFLVMGGTDAYHYENVSENVYRFGPFPVPIGVMLSAHCTDERIPVSALAEGVAFFKTYIREMTKE